MISKSEKPLCNFVTILLALFLCGGCVSLVDITGRALDGSAFAEKKVAVYRTEGTEAHEMREKAGEPQVAVYYWTGGMEVREVRNKAGEHSVVISLSRFPTMKIRGKAPDDRGEFYLTSLDYLGGNTYGWNEYRLDLSGSGNLLLSDTAATLWIPDEIEAIQISAGRIKRYDTRITGNDALISLRNRRERILALVEWMREQEDVPTVPERNYFERHWKPVLFPEMTAKKKRPENWQQENDQRVRAEDIRWNTGYTERIFPELLRDVRNSGTLLRDWEEALDWIYIEYNWERITQILAKEIILARAKR